MNSRLPRCLLTAARQDAAVTHPGFEKATQMVELLGQTPPLQGPRLVQSTGLLLDERQNKRDEEKWEPVFRSPSRSNLLVSQTKAPRS